MYKYKLYLVNCTYLYEKYSCVSHLGMSIPDAIKKINATVILYERLADTVNNRIYRLWNILVSITVLAYTPTIVYSSHLLTKTGIQTVSVKFLRDLLHFLQK